MKTEFASLFVDVIFSFKDRGIDPQDITSCILALAECDPAISKPLLERLKEELKRAKSVNDTFDVLRPHVTFFNYEILEFLIEKRGSAIDQRKLQTFIKELQNFCRQSVSPNVLGHSKEKTVVKITNVFRAALLVQSQQATSSNPTSSDLKERERICAPELGIGLEDAKYIQRKLAVLLMISTPSSIYLAP